MLHPNPNDPTKKRKDGPLDEPPLPKKKKQGRRKITIEFIEDKSRRQITFSKRKAGIMKKAYELTTLTGTQALLLIASETGHVYTFATPKLQPFVTRQDGKALIQRCLNTPDPTLPGGVPCSEDAADFGMGLPAMPGMGGGLPPLAGQPLIEDPVASVPQFVESSLVLMVGKAIPVIPGFSAGYFKDLCSVVAHWAQQIGQSLVCLAGGYPSSSHENLFRNPNDKITSEIVVGIKVSEVDYTNPNQPSFSYEKLTHYFETSSKFLYEGMWTEIASKPYIENRDKQTWKPDSHELVQSPNELYVVSTYPNAFVNVVFGVRKQGTNGKGSQVVGISCHTPESHVCKLDIDERSHSQRMQLMGGVEGMPYYHLLPELFK